jgi:outer membrane lipoprotein carrier protein
MRIAEVSVNASSKVLVALAALGAMVPPAVAEDSATKAVIQAVEAKYRRVSAMKADFVQTTRSDVFGEEKQSGEVLLKRPKKMYWKFAEGQGKEFVTNGDTMWVYTRSDNQVIKYSDVGKMQSSAESLLQSLDTLDELFDVRYVKPASGKPHTLELKPKEEGQFKRVQLTLDSTYVVEMVTITDNFDNITELSFRDVRLNVPVPDSQFEFEVPDGAEVIDVGGM